MAYRSPAQLDDTQLDHRLVHLAARDRTTTAYLLAHLAEADARQLHLRLGHESLLAYCVEHLRYSEAAAHKRIAVARVVREYPSILPRIVDGRLSMSTVLTLRPWLNGTHAEDLLAASAGLSRAAVERLLAERFPRSESFEWGTAPVSAEPIESGKSPCQLAPGRPAPSIPHEAVLKSMECTSTPLTGARVVLQVTVTRETQCKLQRAQELLGFSVEAGDIASVLDRALDALIVALEKRRHGLHRRDRAMKSSPTPTRRRLPAALRREVFDRDGGRCAFVGPDGRRCTSRYALEYDHMRPLALGGETTLTNLRLLCQAHNQYEAERQLGTTFIRRQRARRRGSDLAIANAPVRLPETHEHDLRNALRQLGYRGGEITVGLEAATHAGHEADLALRLRAAMRALGRGTLAVSRSGGRHTAGCGTGGAIPRRTHASHGVAHGPRIWPSATRGWTACTRGNTAWHTPRTAPFAPCGAGLVAPRNGC